MGRTWSRFSGVSSVCEAASASWDADDGGVGYRTCGWTRRRVAIGLGKPGDAALIRPAACHALHLRRWIVLLRRMPHRRPDSFLPFAVHHHDGLLHQCAEAFEAVFQGEHFGFGDDQGAAGADDLAAGDELFAVGGGEEVHLVFDGQNRGAWGDHGHRGVAGGGVGDHADHAAMHKAVLLLDALPVGQVDFGAAMLDDGQGGADELHCMLPLETGTDAFGKGAVGDGGHGLAFWARDEPAAPMKGCATGRACLATAV